MSEKTRTKIQLRFCDTDALGHINNTMFAQYSELGRMDLFAAANAEVTSLILARIAVDFVRQVTLEHEVVVDSWVSRIGSTSIVVAQELLADGEVAAKMECVVVFFDYDAQSPARVPDAWREALGFEAS